MLFVRELHCFRQAAFTFPLVQIYAASLQEAAQRYKKTSKGADSRLASETAKLPVYCVKGLAKGLYLVSSTRVACTGYPLVASSPKHAKAFQADLAMRGIIFNTNASATDLRVDCTAGCSTNRQGLWQGCDVRFASVAKRNLKVARLANSNRQARRRWAGSVRPKQTWGHQISGVTQTEVLKLRRASGKATNISKPGACLTLAIALGYGPRGGPHASILKELFSFFSAFTAAHLSRREGFT